MVIAARTGRALLHNEINVICVDYRYVDGNIQLHAVTPSLSRQEKEQKLLFSDALPGLNHLYILRFNPQQNFVGRFQDRVLHPTQRIGKGTLLALALATDVHRGGEGFLHRSATVLLGPRLNQTLTQFFFVHKAKAQHRGTFVDGGDTFID